MANLVQMSNRPHLPQIMRALRRIPEAICIARVKNQIPANGF